MDKYFNSNENKQIIWQLLLENGYFNNIPENNFKQVQSIFEKAITNFSSNNNNITNKNKMVIKYVVENIEVFKKENILKPLEEVKISLDKDFLDKKEEFINLTKKNIPDNINFTNELDKPLHNDEMESMLNNMIKSRDLEINIPNNTNNTNNISSKKVSFLDEDINFIKRLKIDTDNENSQIENNVIENNVIENNVIENNEIKKLLSKILANQELILSKLDKNN